MKSVHNQLAPKKKGFEFLTTLPHFDCSPILVHNLSDRVYRQNDQTWSFRYCWECGASIESVVATEMWKEVL